MWRVIRILLLAFLALFASAGAGAGQTLPRPLRIGLTPTFPHDQYQLLEEWRRYMEGRLGRRIELVRRDSYIETMDLLRLKKLDFAWICEYPYMYFSNQVKLVAVPLFRKRPYYQSYLIVPATDRQTVSIRELRGKIFAYADPFSNSGYLSPRYDLKQMGENPNQFFQKTFFTSSHRKVIEAVAFGLADAGAVSSHVWDTVSAVKPELTKAVRVVRASRDYGFPPFVARTDVEEAEFRDVKKLLLDMAADEKGKALLRSLNLDGFTEGTPNLYDLVGVMMQAVGHQ